MDTECYQVPVRFATLQDLVAKDWLRVTQKGRTGPSGLVVPGYGSWVTYAFITFVEHLLCTRHCAQHW